MSTNWSPQQSKLALCFALNFFLLATGFAQIPVDSLINNLQRIIEQEKIPGAMISIVKADTVLYEGGVGFVDIESQEPVQKDHLFRLGSISKSITALGFLKLFSENKIEPTSSIHEIDPELTIENNWGKEQPISIEHILEHTAGFDDVHHHARNKVIGNKIPTCLDMVDVHKQSLYARWTPGVRMAYSNPGYVLAGHLIEKVTQMPFSQYLENEILHPIGMVESGFFPKSNPALKIAQGYVRQGGQYMPANFSSVNGGPASDFCSNAKEMSLFLKFMLAKKSNKADDLLSQEWFERMENPKTTIAAKKGFVGGYGLGNSNIWANNYRFHGHDGEIDGFSSIYLYSREASFGVAVSINTHDRIWKLVDEILNFYLDGDQVQNIAQPVPEEMKNKYEGFYNFNSPRNQTLFFAQKLTSGHSIEFFENGVFIKDFGDTIRDTLYHNGDHQFFRKGEGLPFVMLLENEQKEPIFWLSNEYAEKGNKTIRKVKNYILLGSLFLSLQCFLIGFLWLLRQFFTRGKILNHQFFILWLPSFFLTLLVGSFLFTMELIEIPETINIGSMTVFLSSIAFFLTSMLTLVKSFRLMGEKIWFKWYYRLTALALSIIAFWFLFNQIIGFRLWAY